MKNIFLLLFSVLAMTAATAQTDENGDAQKQEIPQRTGVTSSMKQPQTKNDSMVSQQKKTDKKREKEARKENTATTDKKKTTTTK